MHSCLFSSKFSNAFRRIDSLMRYAVCALPIAVLADPCSLLCERDGPLICNDGSYNKNGVCHRYLFRGDPSLNDYCYHTKGTAAQCPSSGKPVKVADAERLLALMPGRIQEALPPIIDVPPVDGDRLRHQQPRASTTTSTTTTKPKVPQTPRMERVPPSVDMPQIPGIQTTPSPDELVALPLDSRMEALRNEVLKRLNSGEPLGTPRLISTLREQTLINSLEFLNGPIKPFTSDTIPIEFTGEPGNGPGMTKEWISELTRQLFTPESGFFVLSDAAPLYYRINPEGLSRPRAREIYRAAGRFLALSLIRNHPIGVNLPIMFFGKLLDQQLTLDDVSSEEQQLVESMRFILSLPEEELVDYPITIDGVDIVPTTQNREKLVLRKVNSLITPDLVPMFDLIKQGFNEAIPTTRLSAGFKPAEVKALILGSPDIDIDDLFAHANIRINDKSQLKMFRNVLTGFTQEQRRKFLRFATNLSQTPIGGFARIQPKLEIDGGHKEIPDKLPRVFLCGNSMLLPDYENETEMRQMIILAIEGGTGWK